MPFGRIFGALFCAGFGAWLGLGLLVRPALPSRLSGLFLAAFGISLALGLLSRRSWARGAGVVFCALLVALGLNLVATRGTIGDHLLLLTALAAGILLLAPATGKAAPLPGPDGAPPRRKRALESVALASLIGLLATTWWDAPPDLFGEPEATPALPASAVARPVEWTDFGTGMERARAEQRPVLATFVTDWCPYCKKMARSTWKASAVKARLGDVVAVRVNSEESRERNGYSGTALAARYGVSGYPAQLLLDADGRIIARYDGFQTASQLLSWLDESLRDFDGPDSALAARGSSR